MSRKKIEVGDRITFTATTRFERKKVTRKVVGFDHRGFPEVRYAGWPNFVVGCFPGDVIHSVEKGERA